MDSLQKVGDDLGQPLLHRREPVSGTESGYEVPRVGLVGEGDLGRK